MMQQHIARAGRIGAGVGSHDPVEAEDRLDRIALEPLVEQVAGRAGEELEKVALAFEIERAQAVSGSRRVDQRAEAGDEPRPVATFGGVESASARRTSVRRASRVS